MSRTLAAVAAEASTCTRCRLAESRTQVVFGVGNPAADLLFIGEAPGFHEDKQGEPFVGAAGQLLTRMLAGIGLILGLAVVLVLARFLTSMLYGVSPSDPVTFLGISFLLAMVALLACYLPARRAARIDPMIAIREE